MPYAWTTPETNTAELNLWPHNALEPRGFVTFFAIFSMFAAIPVLAIVGSSIFWGLLPFSVGALAATWYAIKRNLRDRQITERLTLTHDTTRLTRRNPRGDTQDWEANTYWVRVHMHAEGGPVPFYVTLKGSDREVEIGAFLSEDERKALYAELSDRVRMIAHP